LGAFFAVVSAAHAQWTWHHPQPQGHTLNDIVFLDNMTAIAVGEAGTVLVSHDTGTTWDVRFKVHGVAGRLTRIDRLDSDTAVAVGEGGVVLRTIDQGTQWSLYSLGTTDTPTGLSFYDAQHGIALAGTHALRTSDGGLSWQSVDGQAMMRTVDMLSATDAIAAGDLGAIKTTHDGGATWTSGSSPFPALTYVSLTAIDFHDPLHGAVAAMTGEDKFGARINSMIFVTDNGGTTWSPITPFVGFNPTSGYPYNTNGTYTPGELLYPNSDLLIGVYGMHCCHTSAYDKWDWGELVISQNGGAGWEHRQITHAAHGLARNDDGAMLVVGEDGLILKRDPDGTYVRIGGVRHYHFNGGSTSAFYDQSTGIVVSGDDIMYPSGFYGTSQTDLARTSDGGRTWTAMTQPNVDIHDIAYLGANEICAVGTDVAGHASVLRSVNGGASWSTIWTSSAPLSNLYAIDVGSPGRAVAVGTGGDAVVVHDGAATTHALGASDYWSGAAFATPSVVLAVCGQTFLSRSTDGGNTWSIVHGTPRYFRGLAFATATTAFGVTSDGMVRTDDAGDTWSVVPGGSPDLLAIDFADAIHGVAAGRDGLLVATDDGGDTWTPMTSPTGRTLDTVDMISVDRVFVSGSQQMLFEYAMNPTPTLFRTLDVTPSAFSADLQWSVVADDELIGFSIRRSNRTVTVNVADHVAATARTYRDEHLAPGETYEYRVLAVDRDGSYTQSMPVTVTIPRASLELLPNQPNPFNPETTIRFVMPEKMRVTLTVHDVAGRVVATLVDETRCAGLHSVSWHAEGAASGVYFTRLRAGKTEVSQKMVLLK
jgi:photosystem II stability/assembly factor-like uncharacterized protein